MAPDLLSTAPFPDRTRRAAGFTLVEILLAAVLGAMLLIATATSAGLFGRQLAYLKESETNDLEAALTSLQDELRYAWLADVPNGRTLVVTDSLGQQSSFVFAGDAIGVTRPGGVQGVLLEGLASASFVSETRPRYREGAPVVRNASISSVTAPLGTLPEALILESGDRLALGLMVSSAAPVAFNTVPGVAEQVTTATPTSLSLFVANIPPGNANLNIDLYRARAPDDPRPEGGSLGSVTITGNSLPTTPAYLVSLITHLATAIGHDGAWGTWIGNPLVELVADPPAVNLSIDLSPLAVALQPGCAYTLVLAPEGAGGLAISSWAIGSADGSGVMLDVAGGGWNEQALAVVHSVAGPLTMTRTTAADVVERVLVTFVDEDGNEVAGTTVVAGQVLSSDDWHGVVPGETAP